MLVGLEQTKWEVDCVLRFFTIRVLVCCQHLSVRGPGVFRTSIGGISIGGPLWGETSCGAGPHEWSIGSIVDQVSHDTGVVGHVVHGGARPHETSVALLTPRRGTGYCLRISSFSSGRSVFCFFGFERVSFCRSVVNAKANKSLPTKFARPPQLFP